MLSYIVAANSRKNINRSENEINTPRKTRDILYSVLLLIGIVIVYGKTLSYPYIQDDWTILDSVKFQGIFQYLKNISLPTQSNFYRPIGEAYIAMMYSIFNLNAIPLHIVALCIHYANALFIISIVNQLTGRTLLPWAVGFLYALSSSLHLDTLMWAVGIYDILGAFFFLLSILFFIQKKISLSAIMFGLALLTKEATIFLPCILFFSLFSFKKETNMNVSQMRASISAIRFHLVILGFYVVIRIIGMTVHPISTINAYSVQFFGSTVFDNIANYAKWVFEAIIPVIHLETSTWVVILVVLLASVIAYSKRDPIKNRYVFLGSWIVFGLLPVIFLHQHSFRYYLTYSIPPILCIGLCTMEGIIRGLRYSPKVFTIVVMCFLTANAVLSFTYVSDAHERGGYAPTIRGSNNLMRKGTVVTMVEEYMKNQYPVFQDGSLLVFDGVPTMVFGKNAAVHLWYNNQTLSTIEVQELIIDSMGIFFRQDDGTKGSQLDSQKTIFMNFPFRFTSNRKL